MSDDRFNLESVEAPKKADIIIKNTNIIIGNTQHIASRQEDLNEQTKLAVARIDEAIELFNRTSKESNYFAEQNNGLINRIEEENANLKQELMYLSAQNETIYSKLAEKINELVESDKKREALLADYANKLNDVSVQAREAQKEYSIVADKLNSLIEQYKHSEEGYADLSNKIASASDKITEVRDRSDEKTVTIERVPTHADLSEVLDRLNYLSEQIRRSENSVQGLDQSTVISKLNYMSEQLRRSENACLDMSTRLAAVENATAMTSPATKVVAPTIEVDLSEVLNKISTLSDQIRRSESSQTLLSDRIDFITQRFNQQYNPTQNMAAPAVMPAQTQKEIDYDLLASKVATLLSAKETISPDYIAAKVAEQIVVPTAETPSFNFTVDPDYIASKVAEHIAMPEIPAVNGEEIAEIVANRIEKLTDEKISASQVEFDEDGFADMVVSRLSQVRVDMYEKDRYEKEDIIARISQKIDEVKLAHPQVSIPDEDSIAKRVVEKLEVGKPVDEESIANKVAEKLEAVKSIGDTTPLTVEFDEDGLAERIARKVSAMSTPAPAVVASTPALNEEELADAISLKVGSLKAEDFEILVDDLGCSSISKGIVNHLDYNTISNIIASKLREALDLVALNAPDYEEMAERISEKITVAGINEDSIAEKAAAVLSNYMPEIDTDEITDKVTGAVIDVVSAIPQHNIDSEALSEAISNAVADKLTELQANHDETVSNAVADKLVAMQVGQDGGDDIVMDEDVISKITEVVSRSFNKEATSRFDKMEGDILRISQAIENSRENVEVVKQETEVAYPTDLPERDYEKISQVVATEIEKYTAQKFGEVVEGINKLTDLINTPEEVEDVEEYAEQGYTEISDISDVVASEIQKGVSSRLESIEEQINKLSQILSTPEVEQSVQSVQAGEQLAQVEQDYVALSKSVTGEIESGVCNAVGNVRDELLSRLDCIESQISKLSELITVDSGEEYEEVEEVEEDYSALSEVIVSEIEKSVTTRLEKIEFNMSKLAECMIPESSEKDVVVEDYTSLSDIVASEIEKGVTARLGGIEENILKLTDIITSGSNDDVVKTTCSEVSFDGVNYQEISNIVAQAVENKVGKDLTSLIEGVDKINDALSTDANFELGRIYEQVSYVKDRFDGMNSEFNQIAESVVTSNSEEILKLSRQIDNLNDTFVNIEKKVDIVVSQVEEVATEEVVSEQVVSDPIVREELIGEEVVSESMPQKIEIEIDYDRIANVVADKVKEVVVDRLQESQNNAFDELGDELAHILDEVGKITIINEDVVGEEEDSVVDSENSVNENVSLLALTTAVEEVKNATNEKLDSIRTDINTLLELLSNENIEQNQMQDANDATVVDVISDEVTTNSDVEIENSIVARLADIEESLNLLNEHTTESITKLSNHTAESLSRLSELVTNSKDNAYTVVEDYTSLSRVVASELERSVSSRLDAIEENVAKLCLLANEPQDRQQVDALLEQLSDIGGAVQAIKDKLSNIIEEVDEDESENESENGDVEQEVEVVLEEDNNGEDEEETIELDYTALAEVITGNLEKSILERFDTIESKISYIADTLAEADSEQEYPEDGTEETEYAENADGEEVEVEQEDYTALSDAVATEVEKRVIDKLNALQDNVSRITEIITAEKESTAEQVEQVVEVGDDDSSSEVVEDKQVVEIDYSAISNCVALEVEKVTEKLGELECKINELLTKEQEVVEQEIVEQENTQPICNSEEERVVEIDYSAISDLLESEIDKIADRINSLEDTIKEILTSEVAVTKVEQEVASEETEKEQSEQVEQAEQDRVIEIDYSAISELLSVEVEKIADKLNSLEEKIAEVLPNVNSAQAVEREVSTESVQVQPTENVVDIDYTSISEVVATEVDKLTDKLNGLEDNLARITELITSEGIKTTVITEQVARAESGEVVVQEVNDIMTSEAIESAIEKQVAGRFTSLEDGLSKITKIITNPENKSERGLSEDDYNAISEVVAGAVEKRVAHRLTMVEENIAKMSIVGRGNNDDDDGSRSVYADALPIIVASEIQKCVGTRLENIEGNITKIRDIVSIENEETEYEEYEILEVDENADDEYATKLTGYVASEVERRFAEKFDKLENSLVEISSKVAAGEELNAKLDAVTSDLSAKFNEVSEGLNEKLGGLNSEIICKFDAVNDEMAVKFQEVNSNFVAVNENIANLNNIVHTTDESGEEVVEKYVSVTDDKLNERMDAIEKNIAKITDAISNDSEKVHSNLTEKSIEELSACVADEVEKRVATRLDSVEDNINKISQKVENLEDIKVQVVEKQVEEVVAPTTEVVEEDVVEAEQVEEHVEEHVEEQIEEQAQVEQVEQADKQKAADDDRFDKLDQTLSKLSNLIENNLDSKDGAISGVLGEVRELKEMLANGITIATSEESENTEDKEKEDARFDKLENDISKLSNLFEDNLGRKLDSKVDGAISGVLEEVKALKEMLAKQSQEEIAISTQPAAVEQKVDYFATPSKVVDEVDDEEPLVTMSDLVDSAEVEEVDGEEEDDEEDDGDDFLADVLDMDAFSDDELMPGQMSEYSDGVDFANMMKFKRSFIARIIQSNDDYKQFYGEVKHALISYRKVNSNVAWGAERFNKGRETIARMKIKGKTLCLYLALDPKEYKTSVYHHIDMTDNKSVAGTPMMVKVKSPLGVKKAIRLIDEMLAKRNGEKKEITERNYALMYPYETIEELIEEGLVKDVRNK